VLGAEAFFKGTEPSSPIPMLLARARSYIARDFSSILTEILPKQG
jgi:type VI secretion system protein ImpA